MCGNIIQLKNYSLSSKDKYKIEHYGSVYDTNIKLDTVDNLITQVNANKIVASVRTLGEFTTRSHSTLEGQKVPNKIIEMAKNLVEGKIQDIKYETVKVNSYYGTKQKNVVITIPGDNSKGSEVIIVGAHMDTIISDNSEGANKGADDDASGLATWLEALRVIASNQLKFRRTIEFHAYAAEEVGLYGSASLAETYRSNNRKVAGMFQLDMNMYSKEIGAKKIYLVTRDT